MLLILKLFTLLVSQGLETQTPIFDSFRVLRDLR
jgi:hypothetical protein